jgi:hypothetical protein
MKRTVKNDWLRQLSRCTTLGLIAGAPLFGTLATAEAKPPSHAPAWGYRAKQEGGKDKYKYDKDRDRYDRDDYDHDRYNKDRYYRDDYNRDRYNRDRYERDRYDRDRYDQDRYDRDRNDLRTLSGVVTRDLSGDQFEMRADGGRNFRVDARGDEPRRLSRGDRVVVYGRFDNGRFLARDVRITRQR